VVVVVVVVVVVAGLEEGEVRFSALRIGHVETAETREIAQTLECRVLNGS